MGKLDGAVAVVTGGTRGVGRAIAQAFVREGASVVVNGRDRRTGQAYMDEMGEESRLSYYPGDVCEQATVEGLIDSAVQRLGRLDVLVLNAGGAHAATPVAEMSDEQWRHTVELNLNHVFWGMRRGLQHMIPRREGRILVTSAAEGKLGRPGASGYVAAKHGVNGLVKSVAREVGTLGITVNAILPGVLDSGVADVNGSGAAALIERSKIKRPNTDDEVAGVAVMLASPSMTSITGCLFPVDGGAMPY